MAIAFDNSTMSASANTNSLTFAHTVNSNTNGVIFVAINYNTNLASSPLTGATYAGANLTSLYFNASFVGGASNEVLYGFAPATGSNNVVLTASAANIRTAVAASYTGVKQSGMPDASGTGNPVADSGSTASLTETIVSVADNCWGIMTPWPIGGQLDTAGSNTTIRQQRTGEMVYCDTNAAQTPAGSFTMNVTSTAQHYSVIFFSFAPFTSGGRTTRDKRLLPLMGVG